MGAKQNTRTVVVGLFIFLGLLIIVGGVLVVGGKRRTFERTLTLFATFQNVNGLQKGNNVWFSGVKVGMVKHVRIVGNGIVSVEMKIDDNAQPFIFKDAKAKIASDGLIGNKIVELYGGTAGSPAIASGDTLPSDIGLNTAEMMTTLQESNKNLAVITTNFKDVSNRIVQGQGTVGSLLTNDTLARQLQATMMRLQIASANVQLLSANLASYTMKMQSKGSIANELVTDTVLYRRLKASAVEIQKATINANELTANLKQMSDNLKDSSNVAGVLLNDRQAATNIRASMANIEAGTKKFDENMEALQHNFLFRRFFRKRAKQRQQQQTTKK